MYLSFQPQRTELKASLDTHGAELAKLQSKIDKVEDEVRAHAWTTLYIVYYGVHALYYHIFRCFVISVLALEWLL